MVEQNRESCDSAVHRLGTFDLIASQVILKGQTQGHPDFEALYLVKEPS